MGGKTSPSAGTYTCSSGLPVQITAIPDAGYGFTGWTGDVPSGHENDNPITVTMDSYKSITANFILQYTLTIASGIGGTTDPSPGMHTYNNGTQVSVKATPSSGYIFSGWTGDASGSANPITITIDSDKSITANFTKTQTESDDKTGGCFIATACYGTPIAEEVKILCAFRDQYLLTNPVGQSLVRFYYGISPTVADFIREKEYIRTMVREFLKPIVGIITLVTRASGSQGP